MLKARSLLRIKRPPAAFAPHELACLSGLGPSFLIGALGVALAGVAWAAQPTKRPTDEERGKELYERHCNACHGPDARGHGPATAALVAEVPNLKGKVKPDKATIALVQGGKGPMPAYEATFDTDDTRRVLQWMARLPNEAPVTAAQPKPGEEPPADDAEGPPGPGGN